MGSGDDIVGWNDCLFLAFSQVSHSSSPGCVILVPGDIH